MKNTQAGWWICWRRWDTAVPHFPGAAVDTAVSSRSFTVTHNGVSSGRSNGSAGWIAPSRYTASKLFFPVSSACFMLADYSKGSRTSNFTTL